MKALSLRQPWADWVIQGKKTLELRNWTVNYRGLLAIHASHTIHREACLANGISPDRITIGAIIGVVDLVDIIPLDDKAFFDRKDDHRAAGFFSPPAGDQQLYGWELKKPHELHEPVPFTGRMGLFNVPDGLISLEDATVAKPSASVPDIRVWSQDWDARQSFELRVVPEHASRNTLPAYRLALFQRYVEPPPIQQRLTESAPVHMSLLAELGGQALKAVADQVLDALRKNGYSVTSLNVNRQEPFMLDEESGVRLGLLFMAVRPISKMNRVEAISLGIRAMTSEELYYWFSKCTIGQNADRAQKALRLMLAEE